MGPPALFLQTLAPGHLKDLSRNFKDLCLKEIYKRTLKESFELQGCGQKVLHAYRPKC